MRVAGFTPNAIARPLPRFGANSNAHTAEKHVHGTDVFDGYVTSMLNRSQVKARFFRTVLEQLLPLSPQGVVLDIGTGSGDLLLEIQPSLPRLRFIGMDVSLPMMLTAKQRGIDNVMVADAFKLPVQDNSLDAITLSSVLHEFYSYSRPAFSMPQLVKTMRKLRAALKPGGVIILRDPAKPPNPDELLLVRADRHNGLNPGTKKGLMAQPASLSTDALLRRFLAEFKPAKGKFEEVEPGVFRLPAWLVSEFIQHRPFSKTIEDWNSEIREQYGVLSREEVDGFAKRCGFKVEMAEATSEPEHRSRAFRPELSVSTLEGEAVDMEARFPITSQIILKKPVTARDRVMAAANFDINRAMPATQTDS